ncbi:M48 family metallopeptidase [Corynebacterium mendelii]|uniref:M48 family metallopeptidase n=1 Tax=Corynebacterium mendelii TaxID=2765362 RepID=A0A939E0Z0_9CORY|nr:SprT-like domain-containing protein [Corynebacterium mendelii]MBN9644441.1 M48 family metallopeptidase [Corynebacterium mendelii]
MDEAPVRIIRSKKRRKTLEARWADGQIVVRVPFGMGQQAEAEAVDRVVAKLRRKSTRAGISDEDLVQRAAQLNRAFLDSAARPGSIRWVSNQTRRWGSCTTATGDIRISDRLKDVPAYVLDAVLLHELIHTITRGHGAEFRRLMQTYPDHAKAEGYLECYQRFGPGNPAADNSC